MDITVTMLQEEIASLLRQEQHFLANANQANGAIQVCEQLIARLNEVDADSDGSPSDVSMP